MGFMVHYERKGGGIGNGMSGSVMREFCHGKEFIPFKRLVFCEDVEVYFELLVYPFQFPINLEVIGGEEGNIVF